MSSRLAGSARRHRVLLAAGPRFGLDGAFERHLRLPYTLPRNRVEPAPAGLAAGWQVLDRAPAHPEPEPVAVACATRAALVRGAVPTGRAAPWQVLPLT
ncbi:hypothetical protein [Pseudonocardia sp. H11422]|uniref:hypothetical protein n=1 Tax=Pseudonocardia sp. H11422 TaxID=2835866 RepID=UPI001BDD6E2F|nr:hypothetical protein [Pseudonocardia sp. H11422]